MKKVILTILILLGAVLTIQQVWAATLPHTTVFTDTNFIPTTGVTSWHFVPNSTTTDSALTSAGVNDGDRVLIIADFDIEGDNANQVYEFRVADTAGNAIANTTFMRETRTSDARNTWQRVMTITNKPTNEGFVAQARAQASNYDPHVHKFGMSVISLADLVEGVDYVWDDDTSTTGIPANGSPIAFAATTTPSGDSNWQTDVVVMAHWTADADAIITDSLIFHLEDENGVTYGTTTQQAEDVAEKWGGAFTWVFNQPDTNAHTYKVMLQNSTAATNAFDHAYSSIIVFPATLFEDFENAQTSAYMSSATTFTEVAAIPLFEPVRQGDFLILGQYHSDFLINTSDDELIRIQVDGSTVPSGFTEATEGAGSEVSGDIYNLSWHSIENLNTGTDRDIDLDAQTGEVTPLWGWRNLTAVSMEYTSLAGGGGSDPVFTQSAYRFYTNMASVTPLAIMTASQDLPATLTSAGQEFRLRMLVGATIATATDDNYDFTLQFAAKSGSCAASSYATVTAATVIAWNDNAGVNDGVLLTATNTDPIYLSSSTINQTYEEANDFTNSEGDIGIDEHGRWDFSLKDNSAPGCTTYCLRIVTASSTPIDNYGVYPEVTTASNLSAEATDHYQGQTSNQWSGYTSRTTTHFRYQVIPPSSESLIIGTTTINLSNISGVIASDITNAQLYHDYYSDGEVSASSSWAVAYDGPATAYYSLVLDSINSVIYAGTNWGGFIYRCDTLTGCDEGSDWTVAYNSTDSSIYSLAFDSSNGVIYAGSYNDGYIYRCDIDTSCDQDGDWITATTTNDTYIYALAVDEENGVIYAGSGNTYGMIYRCDTSTGCDDGSEWNISYNTPASRIYVLLVDEVNNAVYAGGNNSGDIYRCNTSSDCDESGDWSVAFNAPDTSMNTFAHDETNGVIYAGAYGYGRLYRCATTDDCDQDVDWSIATDTPHSEVSAVVVDEANGLVYAATYNNVFVYQCDTSTGCTGANDWTIATTVAENNFHYLMIDEAKDTIWGATYDSPGGYILRNFGGDATIGYPGVVSISDTTGTITFATSSTQTVATNTRFLVELTASNLSTCDYMIFDFASASTTGATTGCTADLSDNVSSVIQGEFTSLTAANHTLGQVTNQWSGGGSNFTAIHYRYQLAPANDEVIYLGTTTIDLTSIYGVETSDITSAGLYPDYFNDGNTDSAGATSTSWAWGGYLDWGYSNGLDKINDMAIDAYNAIYAAGYYDKDPTAGVDIDWRIMKFDPDGSTSTNWGWGGFINYSGPVDDYEQAHAIAVTPEGESFVGGYFDWDPGAGIVLDLEIKKFDIDGSTSTTWGWGGYIRWNSGEALDYLEDIAVESDGSIYVAIYADDAPGYDYRWHILKFDPDGSTSTSWGTNGEVEWDNGENCYLHAITLDSDNSVYAAGHFNASTSPQFDYDWRVMKYDSEGDVDITWGWGGYIEWGKNSRADRLYGIAIDQDRNIYLAGVTHNGTDKDWRIMKFDNTGATSTEWGWGGYIEWDGGNDDEANDIAVDADGAIYVGGYTDDGSSDNWRIMKFDPDGSTSTTWGWGGFMEYDCGVGFSQDQMHAILADEFGTVFAGGESNNNGMNWHIKKFASGPVSWAEVDINGTGGSLTFATSTTYGISTTTDFIIELTASNLTSAGASTPPIVFEGTIGFEGFGYFEGEETILTDQMTMDFESTESNSCEVNLSGDPDNIMHQK